MRIAVFFLLPIVLCGQVTISGPAVCKQSTTCTYAASGGTGPYTYSMVSGSVGSINSSSGVYTAPARIVPKAVINGWQSYPNNHVFNTRIDNLPAHSRSAERIANMGHGELILLGGYRSHQTALSTDTPTAMTGYYPYTGYLGNMYFPPPAVVQSEGGTSGNLGNAFFCCGSPAQIDDHWFSTVRDTGIIQEVYAKSPVGFRTGFPLVNAESGLIQDLESFNVAGYGVGLDQIPIEPGIIHMEEILDAANGNLDAIQHAIRFRHNNTAIWANSAAWPTIWGGAANGCSNPTGPPDFLSPDVCTPIGARVRLKSGVLNTTPTFTGGCSVGCQNLSLALIRALHRYGMILGDGSYGSSWQAEMDASPAMIPAIAQLVLEFRFNLLPVCDSTTFEIVDESSLETSNTQNYAGVVTTCADTATCRNTNTWQEAKLGNAYVTPTDAAVIKVVDSAAATAYTSIALQGIAIGVENLEEIFMAGAAPYQFTPWVSGTSNTGLTCTMSPTGGAYGSISNGCLYTPAASGTVTTRVDSTVTVTSSADSFFTRSFNLTVLPRSPVDGKMHISLGKVDPYAIPLKYTDGTTPVGIEWWNDSPTAAALSLFPQQASTSGPTITSAPNIGTAPGLYASVLSPFVPSNDMHFRLHVPNGSIDTKLYVGGVVPAHTIGVSIDSNGTTIVPLQDLNTLVGGTANVIAVSFTSTISNGILHPVIRFNGVDPITDPDYTLPRYSITPNSSALIAALEVGIGTGPAPPIPANTYRGMWRGMMR